MKSRNIVDLKKIVGKAYNSGIYALTDNYAIQLIDGENIVVASINVDEKIKIFNIFLDKLINEGISKDLLNIELLFNSIIDIKNEDIEKSINELFKKVLFLYSKPSIDIKEILSISDLVSNRLNKLSNNEYVKEELQKRLHYV